MKIVGCDLHTRYQQIARLDKETGGLIEAGGPAHRFAGAPSKPSLLWSLP
jgi:hypothetical protein